MAKLKPVIKLIVWKDICLVPGYEVFTNYEISSTGLVRNKKTNKLRKILIGNHDYYYLELIHGSSHKKKILMHRALATLFVDNPMDCKYVDHENGIKLDNRINNLRWCTQSQNTMNSKFKKGASGYKNIGAYERNGKTVCDISMMVDGKSTKEY